MNRHTKVITVGGKKYTLTAYRGLILKLGEICPELLKIDPTKRVDSLETDVQVDAGLKLYANMDSIFYDMIKVAHPEITREKSDEIYDTFCDEYSDVEVSLINFIKSVFTDGVPKGQKKKLDW